ncbi:bifunctional oligoribonuclease/PAP phosphatase NrnA [soil metagenome]
MNIAKIDAEKIQEIIDDAQEIVIVQADNPDGDSIGSALALESMLHEMGKTPYLYCAVRMPAYLRYLTGWDRVSDTLPKSFDASIFVDVSTMTLLEQVQKQRLLPRFNRKPAIVLDHHGTVEDEIPFATVFINDPTKSSAGELVYNVAMTLEWLIPVIAGEAIMTAILGDTQGLSNDLASSDTYRVVASLIDLGVDRPALENRRRQYSRMPQKIYAYKAELLKRTNFYLNDKLAMVVIPQDEINTYSPLYNPNALIQNDMLQVEGVAITIVLKRYDDGKVTGGIRCNPGYRLASVLASQLSGGGHPFVAGFKQEQVIDFDELRNDIITRTDKLLLANQETHSAVV